MIVVTYNYTKNMIQHKNYSEIYLSNLTIAITFQKL